LSCVFMIKDLRTKCHVCQAISLEILVIFDISSKPAIMANNDWKS